MVELATNSRIISLEQRIAELETKQHYVDTYFRGMMNTYTALEHIVQDLVTIRNHFMCGWTDSLVENRINNSVQPKLDELMAIIKDLEMYCYPERFICR